MHRTLTLILTITALAYWGQSLWTLSSVVPDSAFPWACAPALLAFLAMLWLASVRRVLSGSDVLRRRFSAMLATTLLVVIATVYADVFLFKGYIYEGLLEALRLEVFISRRFAMTLAAAGAVAHPILFLFAAGLQALLPAPKDA